MKRKIVFSILSVALSASLLSGCGSTVSASTTTAQTTTTTETQSTQPDSETPQASQVSQDTQAVTSTETAAKKPAKKSNYKKYKKAKTRYVKVNKCYVRKKASTKGKKIKTLKCGAKVTVVGQTKANSKGLFWYKLKSGGYIRSDMLATKKPSTNTNTNTNKNTSSNSSSSKNSSSSSISKSNSSSSSSKKNNSSSSSKKNNSSKNNESGGFGDSMDDLEEEGGGYMGESDSDTAAGWKVE